MAGRDPPNSAYYMQLVAIEEAFRTLKGDLGLRPIFHKKPSRIEAHVFIASSRIASRSPCDNSCAASPVD